VRKFFGTDEAFFDEDIGKTKAGMISTTRIRRARR